MFEKKLQFPFETGQKVLMAVSAVDRFRGTWEQLGRKENRHLKELRKIATVQSIGSSTRIEGSRLSDGEVEKLLSKVKITRFETRDQEEVMGYFEALETILENHAEMPFSESTILQLHGILLRHSGKDVRHRGGYKALPNSVNATYPDGTRKTIFATTPPHLVRKEMESLLAWTREHLEAGSIHPLLVTGLFVYEFLSIHPFQDGNGRLSRLLTTLLLLRLGYGFIQFISFENQIEHRKAGYYRALMDGQRKRKPRHAEDISQWILYFLASLQDLTRKLEKKLADLKDSGGYLNDRQRAVLDAVRKRGIMKLSDLRKMLPGESVNTLKKDLQRLVAEGRLERSGERKGSAYRVGKGAGNLAD